jgi:ferredoxin-NADP reductase
VPHDGKVPLPEFLPGQFLTFDLTIESRKYVRCYSISDCYGPNFYRISIKRVLPPPTRPEARPGVVSGYFHDVVQEGDVLDVSAPAGNFTVDTREMSGLVLSGAGVGVTPVQSMIKALLAARSRREVWFFYNVRNGTEDILKERIPKWRALSLPNFHFHVCYSTPGKDDRQGVDFDHVGHIDLELFRRLLPSTNFDFYTCGPPPMMKSLREGLAGWGVPESRIHDEAFMQVKESVDVEGASVQFKRSNKMIKVNEKITSLLDFANSQGVRIPSGCKSGHCGTCQTALIEGSVHYTTQPAFKMEAGCCLPCVCVPKGVVVLDC